MKKQTIKNNVQAVILAAGQSTRFKTKKTKLLFNICGRSMILYPLKVIEEMNIPVTIVLGHQADVIRQEIENAKIPNCTYVTQAEQKGTGHAVSCSEWAWEKDNILIVNGDIPLLNKEIIETLINLHEQKNATISFCTTMVINPTGYGRIIEKNGTLAVVEEKDCTEEQRTVNHINAGIYIISRKFLQENIYKIKKNPITEEIYLVDLIKMACDQNLKVITHPVPYDNTRGVNTLQELWSIEQIKRSEFIKYWMSEGVRFELAQSIHIDINVKIGAGSFIGTGVHLLGDTIIGEECFVGAFSIIENTKVGNNSNLHSHSVIQDSTIGNNVHVGPYARLRENVSLADNVLIGNFVEMKTVKMGKDTQTKHLTYLGDATIGKSVNIGAGTITCNFDGIKKNKTIIEDEAFIGSNNTLIAPITIGEKSYTAGGSTVNEDVPRGSLAIGRSKQQVKEGYAVKLQNTPKINKENIQNKVHFEKDSSEENKKTKKTKKKNNTLSFLGATKTEKDSQNP
jgi:bifunctional UDP-N-acetylglucosamine pyrophosphorylase / glucosamine-1-phosphate N-acetyltransferase